MKNCWNLILVACVGLMTTGTTYAQIPGTFIGANTTNTALADPDAPEPDGSPRENDDFTGDEDSSQGATGLSRWFDGTNTTGSSTRHLLDADGVEIPDSGGFRGFRNFFNAVAPTFFGGQFADPGLVTTITELNDGDQYEVLFIYTQSPSAGFMGQVLAAGLEEGATEQVTFAAVTRLEGVSSALPNGFTGVFSLPLGTATVVDGQIQVFVDNLDTGFSDPSTAYNGISITLVSDLPGDFDGNGVVDCNDLDGFVGNIGTDAAPVAAAGPLAVLDIDSSGFIEESDAQSVITDLVETQAGDGAPIIVGTVQGDVNCDGTVNVLGDALILVTNLGMQDTGYTGGDINFDGTVNVLGDALILVTNLGMSNSQ